MKIFISSFCAFLLMAIGVKAQNSSDTELLIVPTEQFDVRAPDRDCFFRTGENGCYLAIIDVPEGYRVSYSSQAEQETPDELRQYMYIEGSDGIFSVFVPYGGTQIIIYNENNTDEFTAHTFLHDEPGEIDYYRVLLEHEADEDTEIASESVTGQLVIFPDVDAEVFVDGEPVTAGTPQNLEPGLYRVRLEHALGTRSHTVIVEENRITELRETFRPSRADAMFLGMLIPGTGHIYTKRDRGWFYLAGVAGIAAVSVYNYLEYSDLDGRVNQQMTAYNQATTIDDVAYQRELVLNIVDDRNERFDYARFSLIGAAALYGISILDLLFTEPRFGYRASERNQPGLSLGAGSNEYFETAPMIRFRYSW